MRVATAPAWRCSPWGRSWRNDYHFFRPPAKVTLQVTDSAGSTATLSRRITFVDPDELLVGQLGTNRHTGLPHPYLFRDARFPNLVPCQSRSLDPKSTTVKLARRLSLLTSGPRGGTVLTSRTFHHRQRTRGQDVIRRLMSGRSRSAI